MTRDTQQSRVYRADVEEAAHVQLLDEDEVEAYVRHVAGLVGDHDVGYGPLDADAVHVVAYEGVAGSPAEAVRVCATDPGFVLLALHRMPEVRRVAGLVDGTEVVGGVIRLPRWAWRSDTITHEVAHLVTPTTFAAHGPEYAEVLVDVVDVVAGTQAAERLRARMEAHGVHVGYGPNHDYLIRRRARELRGRAAWITLRTGETFPGDVRPGKHGTVVVRPSGRAGAPACLSPRDISAIKARR